MPLLQSTYETHWFYKNTHVNTILASIARNIPKLEYERERFELPDGDFIDLDWLKENNSQKLVIVLSGLEGNSQKRYMRGAMSLFSKNGYHVVALNHRSCSGEDNRLLGTYHTGFTTDLRFLVERLTQEKKYDEIILVGYSLGGNVVLKYAGEESAYINPTIKKVIGISVPTELGTSSKFFERYYNYVYMQKFFLTLKPKAKVKAQKFPGAFNLQKVLAAKAFTDFDEHFTAPTHGFKNAIDYYTQSSSLPYLEKINIPTLLIIAKDDTFVSPESYPIELASKSKSFHFISPETGGHCGFMPQDKNKSIWVEREILKFVLAT